MAFRTGFLAADIARLIEATVGRHISHLRVETIPGSVLVFGTTNRFFVKQMAQEAIRDRYPDLRIENGIVVRKQAVETQELVESAG